MFPGSDAGVSSRTRGSWNPALTVAAAGDGAMAKGWAGKVLGRRVVREGLSY